VGASGWPWEALFSGAKRGFGEMAINAEARRQ
jgi:hypothetical protein